MATKLIDHHTGAGGRRSPIVKGTRVRVADVVAHHKLLEKETAAERIRRALPHLSVEQIDAALEYWRAHPGEIEAEIQEEERLYQSQSSR